MPSSLRHLPWAILAAALLLPAAAQAGPGYHAHGAAHMQPVARGGPPPWAPAHGHRRHQYNQGYHDGYRHGYYDGRSRPGKSASRPYRSPPREYRQPRPRNTLDLNVRYRYDY